MHLPSFTFGILALAGVSTAQRKWNQTTAFAPGQMDKYHCMTTQDWLDQTDVCIHDAQIYGNQNDGCAYDDWACHCANFEVNANLINPHIFPKSLGGNSTCTDASFWDMFYRLVDLCNFFNATGYAAYAGCDEPCELSQDKVFNIWAHEKVEVTY